MPCKYLLEKQVSKPNFYEIMYLNVYKRTLVSVQILGNLIISVDIFVAIIIKQNKQTDQNIVQIICCLNDHDSFVILVT